MGMRPGGGKSKGANFELKMARKLSVWWGQPDAATLPANALWLRRTPGSGGWQKSVAGGDIVSVAKETENFPFSVELKNREEWSWEGLVNRNPGWPVLGYWQQCKDDATAAKRIPLLVFTKNHSQIYVGAYPELLIDLELSYLQHTGLPGIGFVLLDDFMTIAKEQMIKTCAWYLECLKEDNDGSTSSATAAPEKAPDTLG